MQKKKKIEKKKLINTNCVLTLVAHEQTKKKNTSHV